MNGQTYNLSYDAENRLVTVTGPNSFSATFTYDGDGRRVKSVMDSETILFIGAHYEVKNPGGSQEVTKYYFAGTQRIAVRKYIVPQTQTLTYLLGDHLGSTSLTTDATGNLLVETRYKPWGEVRYTTPSQTLQTRYTFTGQYSYMADEATDLGNAGFGLMFYNARWYDPSLGRFAQADTIVSGGSQGWDRYAAMNNNPVRYTDPSGHVVCEVGEPCGPGATYVPETSIEDAITYMKDKVKDKFGVTLSDGGGKSWDARNVWLAYSRLNHINDLLKGKLKSIIDKAGGAVFDMKEYDGKGCPKDRTCSYRGWTAGMNITFYTTGSQAINTMNFYHEFGHMIDNLPDHKDIFSDQLAGLDNPSFIINNHVNTAGLLGLFNEPIQASTGSVTEQWGDVFANYAAGNIDLSKPPGAKMDEFISLALEEFLRGY